MIYREKRNYHNIPKAEYSSESKYGIPKLHRCTEYHATDFISFNEVVSDRKPSEKGVHFWVDDYRFDRVWSDPDKYIAKLKQYKYVVQPDFSLYADLPSAIAIYNTYRSAWIGRYLQENGVRVVPNVCWSNAESYEYCFDSLPDSGVYAISSVGTQLSRSAKELFKAGFTEFMGRFEPSTLIFYGNVPDYARAACEERGITVKEIPTFAKKRWVSE